MAQYWTLSYLEENLIKYELSNHWIFEILIESAEKLTSCVCMNKLFLDFMNRYLLFKSGNARTKLLWAHSTLFLDFMGWFGHL